MTTPASKTAAGSVGTVDTQFLDLPQPLALDCGRSCHPVRIAYETYGTLSPARDNVILVCHALSGDAHAAGFAATPPPESTRDGFRADERDAGARPRPRLVGRHDRPRQGVRHRPLLRRQHEPARRLPRHDRAVVASNPATGRPYGSDFPVITVADMVRAERAFLDELGITRLAAVAGGSLGGMQALEWAVQYGDDVDAIIADREHARAAAAGRRVECDRAQRDHRRSGLAGRPLLRHRPRARRRAWASRAWSATSRICRPRRSSTSSGGACSSRDDIRYTLTEPEFEVESYLRHQADSFVKRFDANTYLYMSRALSYFDLARQYGGGRLADAVRDMSAQNAAHRVQLRLAVPAVGLRGARGGAARRRQGGRAARDRRAVRTRLFSVGGGAPDSYDSRQFPRGR